MAEVILMLCLGVSVYHYLGYPLAVILLARWRGGSSPIAAPDTWPRVAVIIAAFN